MGVRLILAGVYVCCGCESVCVCESVHSTVIWRPYSYCLCLFFICFLSFTYLIFFYFCLQGMAALLCVYFAHLRTHLFCRYGVLLPSNDLLVSLLINFCTKIWRHCIYLSAFICPLLYRDMAALFSSGVVAVSEAARVSAEKRKSERNGTSAPLQM